jgi:hypothetical protein
MTGGLARAIASDHPRCEALKLDRLSRPFLCDYAEFRLTR